MVDTPGQVGYIIKELKMTEINQVKEEDVGHILVKFLSQGSVFFDFELVGVVPLQMIVIGEYLLTLGKSKLLQDLAQVEETKAYKSQIEIARPNISGEAVSRVLSK